MSATSIILKTDKRGHVRMPPERREVLLAEFDRSGLTLTRFAELAGVRYSTFATWLQQRRNKTGAANQDKGKDRPKPVRFAEVLVDGKRHAKHRKRHAKHLLKQVDEEY
jgi:predicted HTH domain antitoxin